MTDEAQERAKATPALPPHPPTPGDARSRAQSDVEAAVSALERVGAAPVAERLAAAERVQQVLSAHLTGQSR